MADPNRTLTAQASFVKHAPTRPRGARADD